MLYTWMKSFLIFDTIISLYPFLKKISIDVPSHYEVPRVYLYNISLLPKASNVVQFAANYNPTVPNHVDLKLYVHNGANASTLSDTLLHIRLCTCFTFHSNVADYMCTCWRNVPKYITQHNIYNIYAGMYTTSTIGKTFFA